MKPTTLCTLLIVCISLLTSCDSDVRFKQYEPLSKNIEWRKDDPKTITIPISDNSTPYVFELNFRCATGYAYDIAMIRMTETDPEGRTTAYDIEVPVRAADGSFYGEKGYDIIDITEVIDNQKTYKIHGDYTYKLEQTMPDIDPLHYAMEIGLTLRAPKK